jgi:PAS domain S-box-containing protein
LFVIGLTRRGSSVFLPDHVLYIYSDLGSSSPARIDDSNCNLIILNSFSIIQLRIITVEAPGIHKEWVDGTEQFKMLAGYSPNMILVVKDNRIIYASRLCEELTGYTREEFYNNSFPSSRDFLNIARQQYICQATGQESGQYECTVSTRKSGDLSTLVNTRIIFPGGKPAVLCVITDISRVKDSENRLRKQTEELKELNAAKDKFLSLIAHDLKSPYWALLGLSKIIADPKENHSLEETIKLAGRIHLLLNNQYSLIQNLLAWSRLQIGNYAFSPENLRIDLILAYVIDLLSASIDEKNIRVMSNIEETDLIFADHSMLSSILMNIISNAVKFTPKDGKIEICLKRNHEGAEIVIQDNGIGIGPKEMEKIGRLDSAYSDQGTEGESGTGLGILLCREMLMKHKGKMEITSEKGKGTKVSLMFPGNTNS